MLKPHIQKPTYTEKSGGTQINRAAFSDNISTSLEFLQQNPKLY